MGSSLDYVHMFAHKYHFHFIPLEYLSQQIWVRVDHILSFYVPRVMIVCMRTLCKYWNAIKMKSITTNFKRVYVFSRMKVELNEAPVTEYFNTCED